MNEPKQMSSLCGCFSRQVWFGQQFYCHVNSCQPHCEALSRGPLLLYLNVVSVFIHNLNMRISEFIITVKLPSIASQDPQRSIY